jgi:acyl carrier protein
MSNRANLKKLWMDIFLLSEADFRWDMKRADLMTWDSLAVVSLAVGAREIFGCQLTPAEAASIQGVQDLVLILETKGIAFRE